MDSHSLQRHALIAATVVASAYFVAQGTADLLCGRLLRAQRPVSPQIRLPEPFPRPPVRATALRPNPPPRSGPFESAPCPATLRLVGSLQSERQADSVALVSDGQRTRLVHGADKSRWGVARVGAYGVDFEARDGRVCRAVLAWAPVPGGAPLDPPAPGGRATTF